MNSASASESGSDPPIGLDRKRVLTTKVGLNDIVSPIIFSRIMACDSAKKIWGFLKAKYQGDEKIKSIKGLNLVEFEGLHMKESNTIKEYSTKLVDIAIKARMLSTDLFDNLLVQKDPCFFA